MITTFNPDYSFGKMAGTIILISPSKLMIYLISMMMRRSENQGYEC